MENKPELNLKQMSEVAGGGNGSYEDDLRALAVQCIKMHKRGNPNPTPEGAALLATAKRNRAEHSKIIALVYELYDSVTV